MRGHTVQGLMTRDVVTVAVDTPYSPRRTSVSRHEGEDGRLAGPNILPASIPLVCVDIPAEWPVAARADQRRQPLLRRGVEVVREKRVAAVLAEAKVSGLPVLDTEGHVVGVVTEADLLVREEYPGEHGRPSMLPLPGAARKRKAAAETAGELMSTPAITIEDRTSVVRAAREMDRHHIKRLPVVDEMGRLVGIISRRDLLKIFLRSDEDIRAEIETQVLEQSLSIAPGAVRLSVTDGVVTIEGQVQRKTLIPVVVRLTYAVDGVIDVVDRLEYGLDDTKVNDVTSDSWRSPVQGRME